MPIQSLSFKFKHGLQERVSALLHLPHSLHGLPSTLLHHIPRTPPLTLVDVGAFDGQFTRSIRDYCDVQHALLVEPLPNRAALLREQFRAPQYQVFEGVLAETSGHIEFEVNDFEPASSILAPRDELAQMNIGHTTKVVCASRTLDDLLAESDLAAPGLLKIDVQGAECLVLRGAKHSLKQTQFVWVEVSFRPLYEGSALFHEVYALLEDAGFSLLELETAFRSPQGELLQADALFKKL